jgi:hypothetical protein
MWDRRLEAANIAGRGIEIIGYCRAVWTAFTRFIDDGRICLFNNAA